MRSETSVIDFDQPDTSTNGAPDRPGAALGEAPGRRATPIKKPGAAVGRGDEAAPAALERAVMTEARSAGESTVLSAVASGLVLGALYPKELRAEKAKDVPDARAEELSNERASAAATHHPSQGGTDQAAGTTTGPSSLPETQSGGHGRANVDGGGSAQPRPAAAVHHTEASAAEGAQLATQHGDDPSRPAATAEAGHDVHASGQTITSAAPLPAHPVMSNLSDGPAMGTARIAHDLMEQTEALTPPGGLPPAVGLPDLVASLLAPGGHSDLASVPAATVPVAVVEEAVGSLAEVAGAAPVPAILDTASSVLHSVAGDDPTQVLDAGSLVSPIQPIAAVVGSLGESLTGPLERGLAAAGSQGAVSSLPLVGEAGAAVQEGATGLANELSVPVAGVEKVVGSLAGDVGAAPVPATLDTTSSILHSAAVDGPAHVLDTLSAAPAIGSLTEPLTGMLAHGSDAAGFEGTASEVPVISQAGAAVQEGATGLGDTMSRTLSAGDGRLDALPGLVSGSADRTVSAVLDRATDETPVHEAGPVAAISQTLDGPSGAGSHADEAPTGTVVAVADTVEQHVTKATVADPVEQVSSALDKIALLGPDAHDQSAPDGVSLASGPTVRDGFGDDGGLAKTVQSASTSEPEPLKALDPVKGTVAEVADVHSGTTTMDSVGSAVGKAVGGTIDLGPSQQDSSNSSDAATPGTSLASAEAPGDGHAKDVAVPASDVTHATADAVEAAPVHVGFAGQSYVENVESHEHGLASANGMLHGLV